MSLPSIYIDGIKFSDREINNLESMGIGVTPEGTGYRLRPSGAWQPKTLVALLNADTGQLVTVVRQNDEEYLGFGSLRRVVE